MKVLDGIRIIELGAFITGPYAGMLLANMGADVVKVERPGGGDPFRKFAQGTSSSEFEAHNWNKRSIALDYAKPDGLVALRQLLESADVLILNARPGVAEGLGIGWKDMRALNPRLIHCEITGFGATGPYAHRPAFDTVGQALGGWLALSQVGDDPRIAGPALCDMTTGLFAAYGILGALMERERSGVGRHVEVNMVESMLAFAVEPAGRFFRSGEISGTYTRGALSQAFVLTCSDGLQIGIHMSSPEKFWEALIAATGTPALASDARFSDRASRVKNYEALGEELKAIFLTLSQADWIERLDRHDVPFAPVHRVDKLRDDPQFMALDPFIEVACDDRRIKGLRRPVRYDGEREIEFRAPPALGEHTIEVLSEAGLSTARIAELKSAGVL